MNIAIAGSGNVGGALGTRWARNGHRVVFSSRNPEKIRELVQRAGSTASAASVSDAAAHADVVVLAAPWKAAQAAIESAGDLSGKILIDVVNPFLPDLSGVEIGTTTSAGERIAEWAKGAKVVKAFNSVGFGVMADSSFAGGTPLMLYCGDDTGAKKTVSDLIRELGFDAVDAGALTQARVLEPLAALWVSLAFKQGLGPNISFALLRR